MDEAQPYLALGLQFFSSGAIINDNSQITGCCTYTEEGADREWQHAFFYDPNGDGSLNKPRFVVLPEPPEDNDLLWSTPFAMNNFGLIVGHSVCPAAVDKVYREVAVAWDPADPAGNTVKTLQVPDGSVNLTSAADVNDSGQVVCNGKLATTGDTRAVIYTPGSPETYTILQPLGTYNSSP